MFNAIDLSLIARALHHRNYRLYCYGQGTSLIGTWAQRVAVGWLVYRLTGSALMLGVVGFVGDIPAVLAAPIAGVLADRWDRRRLIMVVQSLAMLQAVALAALVLTGGVAVWHIIALTLFSGLLTAFKRKQIPSPTVAIRMPASEGPRSRAPFTSEELRATALPRSSLRSISSTI